jgi:hypothetical protein
MRRVSRPLRLWSTARRPSMQSAALDPHAQRRLQNPYNNPLRAIQNFYAVVAT